MKLLVLGLIIALIGFFYFSGYYQELQLAEVQSNLSFIRRYYELHPIRSLGIFITIYIFITGLSIPGAIVLTLLSGAIFGLIPGTLLVTFCCTAGATISFLLSRYFFKDYVENKFRTQLTRINHKLKHDGNFYFLSLRMVPVSPYVVINLIMGVTSIRLFNYVWMTFVGMLPGNFVYVLAGQEISEIESPGEILTPHVLISLTLIGILPLLLRKVFPQKT